MDPYVTLKKQDKNFTKYLEGSFSNKYRAVPEQSLNINTVKEQVTFRILPIESVERPNIFVLLFLLFRLDWISLSLGPILATYSFLYNQDIKIFHKDAFLAILSVVLFHSSIFALNDYRDHINGVDRVNFSGGSQVIQQGWLSAHFVKKLGLILFAFAATIGMFLIFKQPIYLVAVGLFVAFSAFGSSFLGRGLKALGFGEFVSFFGFGLMLTYGFSRAAAQSHSWQVLFLGIPLGHLAAVSLQARKLENIMSDAQNGVKNLATRLGFDRAKLLLQYQFIISPTLFALTLVALSTSVKSYFLIVPFSYFSFKLFRSLSKTNSSFSSSLDHFKLRVLDLHVLLSTLLLIAFWIKN